MSIWKPVSTSFIEEDDVFNQEAEEWNYDLKERKQHNHITKISFKEVILVARQESKQSSHFHMKKKKQVTEFSPVSLEGHVWS